jgi:hypothetical protein
VTQELGGGAVAEFPRLRDPAKAMSAVLATYGRFAPPHPGGWDWWPLAGIAIVAIGAGLLLHHPLRAWVAVAAVAFGPVFATTVHAVGAPVAVALAILALVTAAILRRPQPG